MGRLDGKVAWVTGAGSGIGEAAALALASEGATVALTGRREDQLRRVAEAITRAGGTARVHPADLSHPGAAAETAAAVLDAAGRLDVLVNNAGLNIPDRAWSALRPEGVEAVVGANLTAAFACALAVLPAMRAQRDGVLIHTASLAGRFVSLMPGPAYVAAKHGVVAMSHSLNMEEGVHGIRSTALCPGEVATPILEQRPIPVPAEERARMVQPDQVGDLIRYVACLPPGMCINEVIVTPTWNRAYVAALQSRGA